MSALPHLAALGPSGEFRAGRTELVSGVDGTGIAELSLVPGLYVKRTIDKLRRARPLALPARLAALGEAGKLFLHEVGGVSLPEHERLVAASSGVALPVVETASRSIAHSASVVGDSVGRARPTSTSESWRDVRSAGATWVRRGEVLAVQSPANHPATHSIWLEALALGYRVAVRPSGREPFTAHRLVQSLRACGFGDDHVAYLPTDHAVARQLVAAADLAVVYGGADVAAEYGGRSDVLVQGPGRSKILVTDGHRPGSVDVVADSVAGFGGTACVNASAVLVEGDARGFAEELAHRLARIAVASPVSDAAVLPAFSSERARSIEAHLRSKIGGGRLVGGGELFTPLPEGGATLRPAVVLLDRAQAPQLDVELPFPCVWVAPWSTADGIGPLRGSLTVTALTEDDELLSELADDPTIGNLHIGNVPTYSMRPGLPHDGHLAEFLMRSKTVVQEDGSR
ncbi:aldehyde dehydrogenase family protein [Amycolatopsis sp. lyj-23]|uniref:aldehyde dehydrogenase family protein n=1 Tax=Amycolatopsis sp. lyj-23 TaxID=2789283 RepID=UPI00397C7891